MNLQLMTSTKCFYGMLYSIIYGSLVVLLVFLGVIWCSTGHPQMHQSMQHSSLHQQLPNNLQNHRMTPELPELSHAALTRSVPVPAPTSVIESKDSRIEAADSSPPPSIRRSYQSSGYGNSDYSNSNNNYGGSQQQPHSGYGQQTGRQFDPMQYGGGVGGSFAGQGAGYYPGGYGLENRFLSLFPRRSSFYQPYYPYGPFGSYGGYGGNQFGGLGVGQYGYPGMGGGGGLGGLGFGTLGRLAQASSLLTGGLLRDRLQPAGLGALGAHGLQAGMQAPSSHPYDEAAISP